MMKDYVVFSRKYRPSKFEDVIGQNSITETLKRAIEKNCLAQAFLFCGPHGVGKTTCARILAKKINEEQERNFDFNIFEIDAASNNSVDDIRSLIDQVRFTPQKGRYKVYIIDEVHMLSQAAFNAFLKVLEFPPSHVIFILATTEKHKVLPTVISRCQIYEFKRISTNDIFEYLKILSKKENIEASDEALFLISRKSEGSLRDALSFFDGLVSFSSEVKISVELVRYQLGLPKQDYYFKIVEYLVKNDIPMSLLLFDEIFNLGSDPEIFLEGLESHLRDLLVSKDIRSHPLLKIDKQNYQKYLKQASEIPQYFLIKALEICYKVELTCKSSRNTRLYIEIALMKIASI